MAFHSDREGRHRLYTIDLATGRTRRLTDGHAHHDEQPAWSPDGRTIAFVTNQFDGRTFDIALMDADGGPARRLTTGLAHERHPSWSHNGGHLLFSREHDGPMAVFRLALDSGAIDPITAVVERTMMASGAPGGGAVVFAQSGRCGLFVTIQDGRGSRPLSPPAFDAAEPQWAPDGSAIAYTVFTGRATSAVAVHRPGSQTVRLLQVAGMAALREPAWSPDSTWIAVSAAPVATRQENWDLVLLPASGVGQAFRLTTGEGSDHAPSWSP